MSQLPIFQAEKVSAKRPVKVKKRPKGATVKQLVLPHTQAKLDLYESYLETYLTVLQRAKDFSQINLYDIYCGNGIYDDGKPGSPLIALRCVRRVNDLFRNNGWATKKITLTVNDGDPKRSARVKDLLEAENVNLCCLECHNKVGAQMLELVTARVKTSRINERNLLFIDPYGYNEIHKQTILELLTTRRTEIILFLPVAQMHRFSKTALKLQERRDFEALRRFIHEFLPDYDFKQRPTVSRIFGFMHAITQAFTFDNAFYACHHYIQRDGSGNYYGVFFITHSQYGLDKMLNVKWKEDEERGQGFRIPDYSNKLFVQYHQDEEVRQIEQHLTGNLIEFLKVARGKTNGEVYEFLLRIGYTSKIASPIIKKLLEGEFIELQYTTPPKKGMSPLYLTWENRKEVKAVYKLTSYGPIQH